MKYSIFFIATCITLMSCWKSYNRQERIQGNAVVKFDLQGHRGARGLAPENSIPAFKKALDLGVSTLELDLAVTKDSILVVSHEPWFSSIICVDSLGNEITEEDAQTHNIYQMTYQQVITYNCGSRRNANFPQQELQAVIKPELARVIEMTEEYVKENDLLPVYFNIEIKSRPEGDNLFHPEPAQFSDLVYTEIDKYLSWERVTIQSFDFRVLQYFNKKYPKVRLAVLIENDSTPDVNLAKLGFNPEIYSSYYRNLTEANIDSLHNKRIQVIPWTVNEMADMERLFAWGVDGLITDYPNRFWESRIDPESAIEYIDP